jgi:hypothetical protein
LNKKLNIIGWVGILILAVITFIPLFGSNVFGKTITYGVGIGDIFYVCLSLIATIVFAVLLNLKKIKANLTTNKIVLILIYISIMFFCYSFSFGRGGEYQWNGELFYPSSEKSKKSN